MKPAVLSKCACFHVLWKSTCSRWITRPHWCTVSICLPLCQSVHLFGWNYCLPGFISLCHPLFCPSVLTLVQVFFLFSHASIPNFCLLSLCVNIMYSVTINVHICMCVKLSVYLGPFPLVNVHLQLYTVCATQMQHVSTDSGSKWQHRPTKKARWLLCLWAVDAIHMCESHIVRQGDHSLSC